MKETPSPLICVVDIGPKPSDKIFCCFGLFFGGGGGVCFLAVGSFVAYWPHIAQVEPLLMTHGPGRLKKTYN